MYSVHQLAYGRSGWLDPGGPLQPSPSALAHPEIRYAAMLLRLIIESATLCALSYRKRLISSHTVRLGRSGPPKASALLLLLPKRRISGSRAVPTGVTKKQVSSLALLILHTVAVGTVAASSAKLGTDAVRSPTRRRLVHDVPNLNPVQVPGAIPSRKAASSIASSYLLNTRTAPSFPLNRTQNQPRELYAQQRGTLSSALELDSWSRQNTASEPDEEAEVYGQTRMLQDPRGRLLYVGDSATLSYLQLIRMIVDHASGPSSFTMDPNRHKIMESSVTIPSNTPIPQVVPDRETASILVESFFTNTCGLVDVLDRHRFEQIFDACYTNRLMVDAPDLCLMHLTFAIGLVMATPVPNSREEAVIKTLRGEPVDRAEVFFRAARSLGDPVSGFEDADLWSVQALSLMSVYMLAVSKRNAAYAHFGMAVRTAFALGLHRVLDVPLVFHDNEVVLRRNIWRSLFVLDRFLSASLGRPTAISEEDCSEGSLDAPSPMSGSGYDAMQDGVASKGLDATVKACQTIGQILKKIYSKRRISTRIAQEIANDCSQRTRVYRPELDTKMLFEEGTTPVQGLAILHVHLFSCHATILLFRPFFLYLLIKTLKGNSQSSRWLRRPNSKLEKFAEACVAASIRTIVLVRAAYRADYLPQRNPFILYFLFAAVLIILSNEFAGLYRNTQFDSFMSSAIETLSYCAETDVQAHRLLFIIESFHAVVQQRMRSAQSSQARPLAILIPVDQHTVDRMSGSSSRRNSSTIGEVNRDTYFKSHSTAPMPNFQPPSGSRPSIPKTSSTTSSTSSRATTSIDQNVHFKTEPDMSDSLGGEHEFDFDSFWDIAPSTGSQQSQVTAAQPRSSLIAHQREPLPVHEAQGPLNGFDVPQGQSVGFPGIPGTPLYTRGNF
ncbi:Filamentous growth regulator [Paramyrothecium foliicola]|nr:Filamentous growth regulator [Paramyrothecium foliicola]